MIHSSGQIISAQAASDIMDDETEPHGETAECFKCNFLFL